MPPVARPVGRPNATDSAARQHRFETLILSGRDFDDAALVAKVKPVRALAILSSDPLLLQAVATIRADARKLAA